MDSLSSVSPSIVLPSGKLIRHHNHRRRIATFSSQPKLKGFPRFRISIFNGSSGRTRSISVCCKLSTNGEDEEKEEEEEESLRRDDEVERALRMDGTIPKTPNEFVEQVSSRAYDMRRHLQQSFDSSSYDGEFHFSTIIQFLLLFFFILFYLTMQLPKILLYHNSYQFSDVQ